MRDLSILSAINSYGIKKNIFIKPFNSENSHEIPNTILKNYKIKNSIYNINYFGTKLYGETIKGCNVFDSASAETESIAIKLGNWAGYAEQIVNELYSNGSGFCVEAEFLASLADPRPFIIALKKISLQQNCPILFSCTHNGFDQYSWSAQEFSRFLSAFGFSIIEEINHDQVTYSTCIATIESIEKFFNKFGMSKSLLYTDLLLFTNEDASFYSTGGIGTYTKTIKSLNQFSAVLLCNHLNTKKLDGRTFTPNFLIGNCSDDGFFNGIGAIDAIRVLLCILPNLEVIEFQDYQSIGFRLVQSKKTGGLPQNLHLRLFMHGSTDYVKYGIQDNNSMNYSPYDLSLCVKDSYIFQNADECYSPSRYLAKTLIENEFGYQINNLKITPLPFLTNKISNKNTTQFKSIDKIVFIGKYNTLKGWPQFLDALNTLHKNNRLSAISKIISLAPLSPTAQDIETISNICTYEHKHLSHDELLSFVNQNKVDTLFVVPSRGENYPFVILEQLLLGTRLVAFASGGAVEVVDDPQHIKRYFCPPDSQSLANKIDQTLSSDVTSMQKDIEQLSNKIKNRQEAINESWKNTNHQSDQPTLPVFTDVNITIAIPIFNTRLIYVKQLINSINNSIVKPKEVLFINDGSKEKYVKHLQNLIKKHVDKNINFTLINQNNQGLSAARNKALSIASNEFIFFIDSDDILCPNALGDTYIAMKLDKDLVATTGFGIYFHDFKDIATDNSLYKRYGYWKPIGLAEAKALSLHENQFITANTMIRKSILEPTGGWDATDKSTWEDWALFTKLAWQGYKFSLMPDTAYLYRNSPNSMSRTYNRYFGRRRLIRNLPNFSKLDANILFSLANNNSSPTALPGKNISDYEIELINLVRNMLSKPILKKIAIRLYKTYHYLMRKMR